MESWYKTCVNFISSYQLHVEVNTKLIPMVSTFDQLGVNSVSTLIKNYYKVYTRHIQRWYELYQLHFNLVSSL